MFWMDVADFAENFSEFYICRVFKPPKWTNHEIRDVWDADNNSGIPYSRNKEADCRKNRQYKVTVNKPSQGFVYLASDAKHGGTSLFKGEHMIYFLMETAKGARIDNKGRKDKKLHVANTPHDGVTDLLKVSADFQFS